MPDLLKSFWSKLYAWALPSALALGAYWLLIYPKTKFPVWPHNVSGTAMIVIFAIVTGTIAFCLNALSTPLYRILEGYLLWPGWLQRWCKDRQRERKNRLKQDLSGTGWKRDLAIERLAYYPLDDDQVVPTRFGNALRAFETYGASRFNLDSQTLWYELCAVVPKYLQDKEEDPRSEVDFFVASVYLSIILCIVALVAAVEQQLDQELLVVAVLAFAVMLVCRWMLVRVTRDWSLAVQGIVNVGRKKLAATLGLQLPSNLEAERLMWGCLTEFVFYGRNGELLDPYRTRVAVEPREHAMNSGRVANTENEAGEADEVNEPDEAADNENVPSEPPRSADAADDAAR
jgi:hypothetical protein